MKKVIMSVSILVIGCACFAEPVSSRNKTKVKYPAEYVAPARALKYLLSSQEPDGSWGTSTQTIESTSLCLSALLRRDMLNGYKNNYNSVVKKAFNWLMLANPVSEEDHIAIIVALSDFYTTNRTPAAAKRVKELIANLNTDNAGIWVDFLSYTRLPNGVSSSVSLKSAEDMDEKYRSLQSEQNMQSIEDYLRMYLISHAKYRTGFNTWDNYFRTFTIPLLERQQSNGAFQAKYESKQPAITSLVIMSINYFRKGSSPFDPPRPPVKKVDEADLDQEIDI